MRPIFRRIGPLVFRFDPFSGQCTGILDLTIARLTPQVITDFASGNVTPPARAEHPNGQGSTDDLLAAIQDNPEAGAYAPSPPVSYSPPSTRRVVQMPPRVNFDKVRERLQRKDPS